MPSPKHFRSFMSSKGEKYKSKSAKMKHEKAEGSKERMKEYGSSKKKAAKKVSKVMREYKEGTLHSGKGGPVVKSRKQAVAIALSEAKRAKKK